jgi:hypothetical protein
MKAYGGKEVNLQMTVNLGIIRKQDVSFTLGHIFLHFLQILLPCMSLEAGWTLQLFCLLLMIIHGIIPLNLQTSFVTQLFMMRAFKITSQFSDTEAGINIIIYLKPKQLW